MNNFSIQLYSVKNSLEEDFRGTLEKISDMGYDGVEFAGKYGGYSGEELREVLDYFGLEAISAHLGLSEFENNFEYHADILSKAGCHTLILPYTVIEDYDSAIEMAKKMVTISEKCAMNGFEFGYHNHAHEFKKDVNGDYLFDIMMDKCGPLTLTELDLGWLAYIGIDVEGYIRKYAGRVNYLHLKQFKEKQTDGVDPVIKTLEKGVLDCKNAIKIGKMMGCEHFIVEQDRIENDEMSDAKANIDYLRTL